MRGGLDRVAAAPHLDRVRSLWLADEFRGRDLRPLAETPRPGGAGHFSALEELRVGSWTGVDDFDWNGVATLAACRTPRLRELHLINLLDDDRGAAAVAAAPWFAGLERLDVYTSHVGDTGLFALLSSPLRQNLSKLGMGYGRVTAGGGIEALVAVPADPPLRRLSLTGSLTWLYDRRGRWPPAGRSPPTGSAPSSTSTRRSGST